VVDIHKRNYPKNLLTTALSDTVLLEYYKKLLEECNYSFIIKNSETERIIGITQFSSDLTIMQKTFFKDHIADILITFIKKPYIFLKILRNRYFSRNFKSKFINRLFNILIDKDVDISMIQVISDIESVLIKENVRSYGHSVEIGNLTAINFYIKNGCRIEKIQGDRVYMFKKLIK
jgi:hypothetical protein